MIFSTLLSMLFIAAGVFQSFQDLDFLDFVISVPNNDKLTFDASFYFMLSTLTTIGYGDIRPASISSRLFVGMFMVFFIFLISKQIADLHELLKVNIILFEILRQILSIIHNIELPAKVNLLNMWF